MRACAGVAVVVCVCRCKRSVEVVGGIMGR